MMTNRNDFSVPLPLRKGGLASERRIRRLKHSSTCRKYPHAYQCRDATAAQRRVVQGDTSKSIDVCRYRYTRRWGPGERIPPSRIKGSINTIIYKQNQTKPCYYCKKSSIEISSSMDASIIGPSATCSPNMYLYLDHTTFYRVDLVGTTDY